MLKLGYCKIPVLSIQYPSDKYFLNRTEGHFTTKKKKKKKKPLRGIVPPSGNFEEGDFVGTGCVH